MNTEEHDMSILNTQMRLLSELTNKGCWEGRLSSSALATATAAFALMSAGHKETAQRGFRWLAKNGNIDGGWGDSPESPSNFAATLLCWCALSYGGSEFRIPFERAGKWLSDKTGRLDGGTLFKRVLRIYGNDRTFAAPILTMCQLAGRLDGNWKLVPQLPFELAVVPHRFYKWLRLPVVSYALPALIAIGIVKHRSEPSKFLPLRILRNRLIPPTLKILRKIQPESGGFLEAAPLNAFVAMSLSAAGFEWHPVTKSCISFLENTIRSDGSWPIDINLATWLTSLSVHALTETDNAITSERKKAIHTYLLDTQLRKEHPFTHSAPGGWGWTHASGGVPDTDDTAAALLALWRLDPETPPVDGIYWLLNMQNRDGGIPAFCKGWGSLPFDRSCPDITAHAIHALSEWRDSMDVRLTKKIDRQIRRALNYLADRQCADGSWLPLWFGNQYTLRQESPLFGTARVLEGLASLDRDRFPMVGQLIEKAVQWLDKSQNADGGWGGATGIQSTIEETALAVSAVATLSPKVAERGKVWLIEQTRNGTQFPPAPIGLYFASLWYSERLYPVIFTLKALLA
jgi:squalene-hopene/tetraprenyl-beta-curcumene cyclase